MQYGSFFSVLHPSSIYPLSHARLLQKCFNFFLAHPGPAVRINQYNSGSGPQRVQTVFFQVFDIWSVSTLRLLLITVAIMASRVSVPAVGPAAPGLGCPATRRLCVCQVHRNRPTVQPVPVSQSGCGPAPYCCFQAVPCSQTGLPGNPSWCPDQWRHGRSRGRRGTRARRLTSARRNRVSGMSFLVYIYLVLS